MIDLDPEEGGREMGTEGGEGMENQWLRRHHQVISIGCPRRTVSSLDILKVTPRPFQDCFGGRLENEERAMLASVVHLLTCDNAPSCLESETATGYSQDCLSPTQHSHKEGQSYFPPGRLSFIIRTKGCAMNNCAG